MSSTEISKPEKVVRNKETTRRTIDCLQVAILEGIGDHLRLTEAHNQENADNLYCQLCATWLSTKTVGPRKVFMHVGG